MEKLSDQEWMLQAIHLARGGRGFVSPNPLVGCVVVSADGQKIGQGLHRQIGGPHAEVDAIQSVVNKESLIGATVFVTLEPCSHFGRTPPCADLLASLPVKRIVFGLEDPNPKVSGRGIQKLRDSGKQVDPIEGLQVELENLAEIFLFNQKFKRAFTAFKVATTLDGQMADYLGEQKWITGSESKSMVHELRGEYDAIAVGVNTLLLDNPMLNTRSERYLNKKTKVIILDPKGRLATVDPAHLQIFRFHEISNIVWITSKPIESQVFVNHWVVPTFGEHFDWTALTQMAFEKSIYSIFVEAGPGVVAKTIMQTGAIQRWYQFINCSLMGGLSARSLGSNWGFSDLNQRIKLKDTASLILGSDLFLTGRI